MALTLAAAQIKAVLEQQFSGCPGQTENRVMPVSASLNYMWSAGSTCGTCIKDVTLTPVELSTGYPAMTGPADVVAVGNCYRITVNNFMAPGGDAFTTFVFPGQVGKAWRRVYLGDAQAAFPNDAAVRQTAAMLTAHRTMRGGALLTLPLRAAHYPVRVCRNSADPLALRPWPRG